MGARSLSIRRFLAAGTARGQSDNSSLRRGSRRDFLTRVLSVRKKYAGRLNVGCSDPLFNLLTEDLPREGDAVLGGCTAGIASCAIGIAGEIKICTRVDFPIGNVLRDDLELVWEGHSVLALLRDRNALHGRCGKCSSRWICGGCRGAALLATGDLLSSDPACWESPARY